MPERGGRRKWKRRGEERKGEEGVARGGEEEGKGQASDLSEKQKASFSRESLQRARRRNGEEGRGEWRKVWNLYILYIYKRSSSGFYVLKKNLDTSTCRETHRELQSRQGGKK